MRPFPTTFERPRHGDRASKKNICANTYYYKGAKESLWRYVGTARNVRVTLDWERPYTRPDAVPPIAGIYMVIAAQMSPRRRWDPSTYMLIDIGQSGDGGPRLGGHERRPCWERHISQGSTLMFKFAPMPSRLYDETDRQIVECCLRAHAKPACGTECDKGYNRDDTVVITNTSWKAPLDKMYRCGP